MSKWNQNEIFIKTISESFPWPANEYIVQACIQSFLFEKS